MRFPSTLVVLPKLMVHDCPTSAALSCIRLPGPQHLSTLQDWTVLQLSVDMREAKSLSRARGAAKPGSS